MKEIIEKLQLLEDNILDNKITFQDINKCIKAFVNTIN